MKNYKLYSPDMYKSNHLTLNQLDIETIYVSMMHCKYIYVVCSQIYLEAPLPMYCMFDWNRIYSQIPEGIKTSSLFLHFQ